MPIYALDPTATKSFTPPGQDDGSPKTRFELRTLDGIVLGHINDQTVNVGSLTQKDAEAAAAGDVSVGLSMYKAARLACQFGISGWENFTTAKGDPVKFDTKQISVGGRSYPALTAQCVASIPPDVQMAVYQELTRSNTVTEEERGNSDAQ